MKSYRRWKLFWMDHWIKIAIVAASLILILLSIWGMASLESYYRNITLAQLPLQMIIMVINAVVFAYIYMVLFRGNLGNLEKKKNIAAKDVNVKFSDVIGIDEAKEECWEVVQLIKDHARLKKIGGKILRGILMMGPPGCGKTYLAKAIATEAGLPFLSMAASEFNEIFVGVGASRVRQLFKKAARMAYGFGGCIVFIDELDAMGHRRTFSQFGSGEGNTTQNQLLVAMDGLGEKTENIVVIGATNAAEDVLDPALLRPGRFDRKVYIKKPNLEGREALFKFYLGKVKHEASVDCKRLARKAVDKSPADIENIVKESALIATRNKRDSVTLKDISEAIERIELGVKQKLTINVKEREMTAYHETGHLIVTYLLHPRDDVFKASIIPRKMSLGVVHPTPIEEWHLNDRESMLAEIKVCVASYVAEKIKFGTTTTGVGGGPGSDFYQATNYANAMVWKYGMGPSGLVGDYTVAPQLLSEEMKTRLNQDVDKILKDCMAEVDTLLRKEKDIFERFAHELLQKNELDYDEIEAIFMEYGKANPRRAHLTQGGTPPAV
ncbi:MAG TPA: AAA family ATPase [Candidatus Omnitrophota bacterium]|nr:AAA family ATPase [Candidatus Omnitrophota bacterium]HQB94359.1 AAA family ATPase [Candidatus Omnitrophota bacterium]